MHSLAAALAGAAAARSSSERHPDIQVLVAASDLRGRPGARPLSTWPSGFGRGPYPGLGATLVFKPLMSPVCSPGFVQRYGPFDHPERPGQRSPCCPTC